MSTARHIPYLPFHKDIIREICRPQRDDLLILAKGLGMRRVSLALSEPQNEAHGRSSVPYSRRMIGKRTSSWWCVEQKGISDRAWAKVQVNATPADEAGIGDELGIMGVRSPGFRVLTHELSVDKRSVQPSRLPRHPGADVQGGAVSQRRIVLGHQQDSRSRLFA